MDEIAQSARALREVLDEGGDVADRIRAKFHRITRWKWTRGRRKPDAVSLTWLHDITDGRVAADGWLTACERSASNANHEAA